AAGAEPGEARRIGVHVERQAVPGDPPAHGHADRADLALADPHAGQARAARALDAELGEHADHDLLEVAQVTVEIAATLGQGQDRVGDELSGTVVGRLAPAFDLDHGQ